MGSCKSDAEYEYFADSLSKVGDNYYKELAASIYEDIGKEDKFLEVQKANLVYGSDYMTLSNYYENHGQKELAIKNAWKGLDKCLGRRDKLYIYLFRKYKSDERMLWKLYQIAKKKWNLDKMVELMYDYFKKKDYANQKDMLLELVQCCDSRKVRKWYKRCKLKPQDRNE